MNLLLKVRSLPLFLIIILLLATLASTARALMIDKVQFESEGKRITLDTFEPQGSATLPPIVILHGAGGFVFDGPAMRRMARRFAAAGHSVYVLHYFDRTGTKIANTIPAMRRNFPIWLDAIRSSITWIQERRGDSAPVGIYGYSLGGFLALAAASDNPRVGGVVSHSGGIWDASAQRMQRLPPVLIVHGERDRRVPFKKFAVPLVAMVHERSPFVQTDFFPRERHRFSPQAIEKLAYEAVEFYRRHLSERPTVAAARAKAQM